jgi:hypothetical protein
MSPHVRTQTKGAYANISRDRYSRPVRLALAPGELSTSPPNR